MGSMPQKQGLLFPGKSDERLSGLTGYHIYRSLCSDRGIAMAKNTLFRLFVCGQRNSGKTTLINTLTEGRVGEKASPIRRTKGFKYYQWRPGIEVCDAVGFDDPKVISDARLLGKIKTESHICIWLFNGVNRMQQSDIETVKSILREQIPTIFCVNKWDTKTEDEDLVERRLWQESFERALKDIQGEIDLPVEPELLFICARDRNICPLLQDRVAQMLQEHPWVKSRIKADRFMKLVRGAYEVKDLILKATQHIGRIWKRLSESEREVLSAILNGEETELREQTSENHRSDLNAVSRIVLAMRCVCSALNLFLPLSVLSWTTEEWQQLGEEIEKEIQWYASSLFEYISDVWWAEPYRVALSRLWAILLEKEPRFREIRTIRAAGLTTRKGKNWLHREALTMKGVLRGEHVLKKELIPDAEALVLLWASDILSRMLDVEKWGKELRSIWQDIKGGRAILTYNERKFLCATVAVLAPNNLHLIIEEASSKLNEWIGPNYGKLVGVAAGVGLLRSILADNLAESEVKRIAFEMGGE